MDAPLPVLGLQAELEPAFARRAAALSRWTKAGLAGAVGLALLGVFGGGGLLSRTAVSGADGFAVVFDRFARLDAPVTLAVTLPPGVSALTLTGDLASALQTETVSPAPVAEEATAEGIRYQIEGGAVTIYARPLRFGVLRGGVALDGGERLDLATIVYP